MASHFQIQKPYVLTSLPRPLDPTTGRYVVGEVYGSTPGSKKRKRAELTVGTDGDSINIYEVSSSRLITSYPIPPQSRFTCAPCSIRRRNPDSEEVARYTYVSTHEPPSHRITLFKDLVARSGETTSKPETIALGPGQTVTYLALIRPLRNELGAVNESPREELVVVRADGEIIGLDIETLQKKWVAPSKTLYKGVVDSSAGLQAALDLKDNFNVEFCSSALASDIVQGIFKGDDDPISLFPGERSETKTNTEALILISSHVVDGYKVRNLHIVGVSPQTVSQTGQRVALLYTGPLPTQSHQISNSISYHLDALSGTLLELNGQSLATYDLTASGVPRVSAEIALGEASSFLRLSKTTLLSSNGSKLDVYNPVYRSLQSSTTIDLEGQTQTATDGETTPTNFQLVSYFSRLELAIAIVNSNLVAIQLEAPKTRAKKRRAEGLLIDSIGRGVPSKDPVQSINTNELPPKSAFSHYLPGSVKGDYWEKWTAEKASADSLLNSNDIPGLEKLLAKKFGIEIRERESSTNTQNADEEDTNALETLPRWKWPKNRAMYPYADRRWVLYAISRAFEWNSVLPNDETIPRLVCQLPQSNIVNYLVDAGHLTLSNIKSAFKLNMNDTKKSDSFIAEQLITRLVDLDPSFALLSAYISATTLDSIQLLLSVRAIMRSLELIQDRNQNPPKLLTNSNSTSDSSTPAEDNTNDNSDSDNGTIGMELDTLEEQIQQTESYLNPSPAYNGILHDDAAGIRGAALSAAFAKLGGGHCPASTTIAALRSCFKPEEMLSLVYVLRVELVKGAWTSRYLDWTDFERDAKLDAPPDGIIKLLADLLARCIDAIGLSGWLVNDAILMGTGGASGAGSGGDGVGVGGEASDFIAALKLEVSAALEGLEEAVYLRGVVGEAVKYWKVVEKQQQTVRTATTDAVVAVVGDEVVNVNANKSIIPLHIQEPGAEALPLGLKTGRDRISAQKINAGGEIVDRSARETGHLRSQQVGAYSLERIAI